MSTSGENKLCLGGGGGGGGGGGATLAKILPNDRYSWCLHTVNLQIWLYMLCVVVAY